MHFYLTIIIAVSCSCFLCAQNALPKVSSGTLIRKDSFPSKYVEQRNIDIWLPEGYSGYNKYAVLYMHDGQMLYDSTTNWNQQAWDIDDVGQKLMNEKKFVPLLWLASGMAVQQDMPNIFRKNRLSLYQNNNNRTFIRLPETMGTAYSRINI
jgi:hypothetical protein